jgi:hypothetical protein
MKEPGNIDAALDRLRTCAQNAPLPNLDVAGIEKRVLAEATRSDVSSAFIAVPQRRWPTWAAIGIAATISLFVATQRFRTKTDTTAQLPARGQLEQRPGVDGNALALQQQIVATDYDVTVKHAKLATWRLMAQGRARIIENGTERVTIALETGLIEADVIAQPKPESFAIEVANTRIAVHGTIFSVERHGDLAEVVVREGKVMVSHNDPSGTVQRTLLTAPSRAQLDVGTSPESGPTVAAGRTALNPQSHSANAGHPLTDGRSPDASGKNVSPVDNPSAEELDRTWSNVANVVSLCFAEHTAGSPSVRVSFKTQLSVNVGPSGNIAQVDFNPPVPDPVRDCTLARVTGIKTSPSLRGAVLSRPTILSR